MKRFTDRRWIRIPACTLLLASAGSLPALAQDTADDVNTAGRAELGSQSTVTPEAQAVLDRMTATLNGLQRFSITAQISRDEALPFGYKLQNNESARMWVERPNRLRLEVAGDIKDRTYVYDGKQLTMYAPDANAYASTPAPDTLGEMVTRLLEAGVEMPLIDMLYHGAGGSLTEGVRVGILVGDSTINGAKVHHLAFRQPSIDWQIWIDAGPQALPRKLLITTRYEVGDPQYQAVLTWDTKPAIAAKAFSFEPPKGASKIEFHSALFATGDEK